MAGKQTPIHILKRRISRNKTEYKNRCREYEYDLKRRTALIDQLERELKQMEQDQ